MFKNRQSQMIPRSLVFRRWRAIVFAAMSLSAFLNVLFSEEADDDANATSEPQPQYVVNEQPFDHSMFGANQTAETRRQQRLTELDIEIKEIAFRLNKNKYPLSDVQKRKLRVAGLGDVSQCFESVLELRRNILVPTSEKLEYEKNIYEWVRLRETVLGELFGRTSLFQRTLRHTLSAEQLAVYRTLERERQGQVVERAVRSWESRAKTLNFTLEQRAKLVDLFVEKTAPPQTFAPSTDLLLLLQSRQFADDLKPLMSDEQWVLFQVRVTDAGRREPLLRRQKLWPIPEVTEDDDTIDATKG